jgi:hypothetical protein
MTKEEITTPGVYRISRPNWAGMTAIVRVAEVDGVMWVFPVNGTKPFKVRDTKSDMAFERAE